MNDVRTLKTPSLATSPSMGSWKCRELYAALSPSGRADVRYAARIVGVEVLHELSLQEREVREVHRAVVVEVGILVRREEHGLEGGEIEEIDDTVVVEVRVAGAADAIIVGVALVGVRLADAVVAAVRNAVAIAVHGSEVADGAIRGDTPLVRELGAVDREAVVVEQDGVE